MIRTVRHSMGRNVSGVEAEIKELEREMALPGKIADVEDFDEVSFIILYFFGVLIEDFDEVSFTILYFFGVLIEDFDKVSFTIFLSLSVLILRF